MILNKEMSRIKKKHDLKSEESSRSFSNDPEATKLYERLIQVQSSIDEKEREISICKDTLIKQAKWRSVSPGNKLIISQNKRQKDRLKEDPYAGDESEFIKRDLSISIKRDNDSSFFSNENDISKIKYVTNKSNEEDYDKMILENVEEIKNAPDSYAKFESLINFKKQLIKKKTEEIQKEDISISEHSQNSANFAPKVTNLRLYI